MLCHPLMTLHSAAAWTPASLPNQVAWYRADLGTNTTTNGATITSWADQFGLQAAFSTGTGTPTYVSSGINGQAGIGFNGSARLDSANASTWDLTGGYTVVWIGKITTDNTNNCLLTKSDFSGNCWDHFLQSAGTIRTIQNGAGVSSSATPLFSVSGAPFCAIITSSPTAIAWSANGNAEGTGTLSAPNVQAVNVSIGQRGDAATKLTGVLCELIVMSAVIAGADLTSLKSYLSTRYAITIV